jgi:hypothetical protein
MARPLVKRLFMHMTQGDVEAAGVRDHERRLDRLERELDVAQAREDRRVAWLESVEPEDEAA